MNGSPLPVRVVVCQREHGGDVIPAVSERLRDPYPHLRVACLLDPGDPAAAAKDRFRGDGRVSFAALPEHEDGPAMKALLEELAGDGLLLWQIGVSSRVCDGIPEPPIRIEPEDPVDLFVGEPQGHPPADPPEYLNIGLTNRCDYRCFFCGAEKTRKDRSQGDIPIERFRSMKTAIESAGIVDLTSPGEALLYPHIREALAFVAAHNRGRGIQLTTTGARMTEELILPVADRIDQITVSLNAATSGTYERDMGSKLWERVLSNLRGVRRHLARERIAIGFVAHAGNMDELPGLVRLAAEIDAWHVRIAPIFVHRPEHARRSLWFHKAKWRDLLGEARRIGEARGVIVSDIHESVKTLSCSAGERCIMPAFGSYVTPRGDVIPCCYAGSHVMGNIYRSGGFEAVWNGKKYRALRESLYFRRCRKCPNVGMDSDRLDSQLSEEALAGSRDILPLFSVVAYPVGSPDDGRAARGILDGQTYPAWELLEAPERDDADPKAAILRAVSAARGEFVALLDPRRPMRRDRLEAALTAFGESGPEAAVVYELPEGPELFDLYGFVARKEVLPGLLEGLNGGDGKRLRLLRPQADPGGEGTLAARLCRHGEALLAAGFVEEAREAFLRARSCDPSCVDACNDLGVLEWSRGNPVEAIVHLSQALGIDPGNRTTLVNLAEVFLATGAFGKARNTAGRILETHPGDEDATRILERLGPPNEFQTTERNVSNGTDLPCTG